MPLAELDNKDEASVAKGAAEDVPLRRCNCCKSAKPNADFFFKKTEQRFESTCKACKRKKRVKKGRGCPVPTVLSPEPKKVANQLIEPRKHIAIPVDYGHFENLYGRPLSATERVEIEGNLKLFFGAISCFAESELGHEN